MALIAVKQDVAYMMSNGKGDTYRPTDKKRFDKNYEKVFGEGIIGYDNSCNPIHDLVDRKTPFSKQSFEETQR